MLAIDVKRLLCVALCAAFCACAGAGEPAAESPGSNAAAAAAKPEAEKPSTAEYKDDAEDKGMGGWRWRGRRQDCFFVYDNECYADLAAACKAAGCAADACSHDDAAPAKVSCD